MEAAPRDSMLEEGYRGFLIRIPLPGGNGPLTATASVEAVSDHAAAHIDDVGWERAAGSEGDLHTLAKIKHAIDLALDEGVR